MARLRAQLHVDPGGAPLTYGSTLGLQARRWLLLRACARPQVRVRVGSLLGQTGAMRDVPLD